MLRRPLLLNRPLKPMKAKKMSPYRSGVARVEADCIDLETGMPSGIAGRRLARLADKLKSAAPMR